LVRPPSLISELVVWWLDEIGSIYQEGGQFVIRCL
jgi:hypothetical protein